MKKLKNQKFIPKANWVLALVLGAILFLLLSAFFNNTIYYGQTALNVALAGLILWALVLYKNKQTPPFLLLLSGFGFLTFSWLSFFFSQTRTLGLNELLLETGLILILFAFPAFLKITQKAKDRFLALLLVIGLAQSLWAFFQYLTRLEPRVAGFFFNSQIVADYYPNAFALSGLLFLSLALGFLYKKERTWQIFGGISAIAIMGALFLSWSRGGVLGLIGMLLLGTIVIALRYKSGTAMLKLLAVVLVAGVLAAGLHVQRNQLDLPANHLISKAQFAGTEAQTSVGERKDFMIGGLKLATEKPLLGYGPGSFTSVYPQIQTIWLANAPHPHNWLIKIAMERGWPAMVFFLTFWLVLLGGYLKKWRTCSDFSNWVFIGVLAALGHNLIDFNFNFSSNVLLLGLLGSLLIAELDLSPLSKKLRTISWATSLFILILLFLGGSALYQNRYAQYAKYVLSKGYEALHIQPFFAGSDYLLTAQWNVEQKELDLAEENFKKHLALNHFDASAWNQLGELYLMKQDYVQAQDAFENALELDGKNNWKYYLNNLTASASLAQNQSLSQISAAYLKELEVYLPLVKQNVHYTAQQNNSLWALELTGEIQAYLNNQDLVKAQEAERQLNQARESYKK